MMIGTSKMNLPQDRKLLHISISPKITCWTYCAPGSGPPLVVCWGHIPAAVPRMASWVLRISVGLVIDALAMVDRGAGRGGTLLLRRRLLIRVAERLVHWLVVVRAVYLPGDSSHATSHWALGGHGGENQGIKSWGEGGAVVNLVKVKTQLHGLLWEPCDRLVRRGVVMYWYSTKCHNNLTLNLCLPSFSLHSFPPKISSTHFSSDVFGGHFPGSKSV